jgi:hypothetical protein
MNSMKMLNRREGLMWRKEDHQKQIGSTADAKPQCNNANVLNAKFSGEKSEDN